MKAKWRLRFIVALGALSVAAPAVAMPEGTSGKRQSFPATVASFASDRVNETMGRGDDDLVIDSGSSEAEAHFGW